MGDVVKFPKGDNKKFSPIKKNDVLNAVRSMPKGSTFFGVIKWLFLIVRLPLFLVMYWLRLPVVFVCNLISIPMLLAWLFALYAFPDKTAMVWAFGIVSFTAFVLAWFYDFILMALSPQDMIATL
jgi:hypothetical protein